MPCIHLQGYKRRRGGFATRPLAPSPPHHLTTHYSLHTACLLLIDQDSHCDCDTAPTCWEPRRLVPAACGRLEDRVGVVMSPAVCPYWTNWDDGWFTTSCECSCSANSASASIPTPLRGFHSRPPRHFFPRVPHATLNDRCSRLQRTSTTPTHSSKPLSLAGSSPRDTWLTLRRQLEQFQVDNLLSAVGREICVLQRDPRTDEIRRSPRNVASESSRPTRHDGTGRCRLTATPNTSTRRLYHPQYYDARATAEYLQNNFPKLCWVRTPASALR